ncbi:nitrate- and nitrite sensing domain-containing protein [Nocardiopsis algeriensis]|uniref:sensor histidine kinase n=1 Tax=Nocardiopsis algeriensis TaxID=1478215 RepID=UPI003B43B9F1
MGKPGGRRRGIKAQLNRIVLIPSITFLALFAVLSTATLVEALSLRASVGHGRAGMQLAAVLTGLQEERRLSAEYLAAPGPETHAALVEAGQATEEEVETLAGLRDRLGDLDDPASRALTGNFFTSLEEVGRMRGDNLASPGLPDAAMEAYTDAIGQGIGIYAGTARSLDDGFAAAEAAAATDLMWAQESFSHADALISSVQVRDGLTRADQVEIAALVHDARHRVGTVHPGSASDDTATSRTLAESRVWNEALAIAGAVAAHEEPPTAPGAPQQGRRTAPPAEIDGWRESADEVNAELSGITGARAASVVTAAEEASSWMLTLALGGGIASLFAGTVAYGVSARSAGRLTNRLARLRAETLGTARTDLPRIVRRLEAGESVDLDKEMKQLDHGDDEVGQVADAFNIAQRTAVSAAVKQADIRAGVNRVFLGIAHRNQSLIQRQLQLLDRVEREEDDPDLLESLFQLDHLATRGRRHAENLIILGGSRPGRRWRKPIPLVDILRGAVSETEEYARIRLVAVPELSLTGAAVADVIHMLAELLENATAYSPPHTEVTVSAESVPRGVAVEIEDRGLGMAEDALARANATLGKAPEFDVMAPGTDAHLGLFVVARLAVRHDIQVQLRPSAYGGTRAVVLIPDALVVALPERPRPTGRAGTGARAALGAAPSEGTRPHLRPVPPDPGEETDEAGHVPRTPLLRQVPDIEEAVEQQDLLSGPEPVSREHAAAAPGRPGLPRRRRQESLVPQLRQDPPSEDADSGPPGARERSPEQARKLMDAFSSGTRRGRAADIDADGHGHQHTSDDVGAAADDHTGESD